MTYDFPAGQTATSLQFSRHQNKGRSLRECNSPSQNDVHGLIEASWRQIDWIQSLKDGNAIVKNSCVHGQHILRGHIQAKSY